jgi:serpin B
MAKVLHLEGAPDGAVGAAGKLAASYAGADQKVTVRLADRLFGDEAYAFDRGYLDTINAAFGAPLQALDFHGSPDAARQRINGWVAKETQDRIKDLVPAGGVDGRTRLVLVNAIYFLGDWMTPFKKDSTGPAPFFTGKTDQKDVPTMRRGGEMRFAAQGGVKVLELPYQGGDLAMTLVLPDAVDGLDAVEARLTQPVLDGWIAALAPDQVSVSLPRVEINPASALSLGPILASLGMPLAFDEGKADFTGIANPPSAAERLHISSVFHKAATAVLMVPRAVVRPIQPPREFKADHPFLFFLRDVRSGLILFMGRVADPSAS